MKLASHCDGSCNASADGHVGEVRTVHVSGGPSWGNHDWGTFRYCEQAIETDVTRGFTVEVVANVQ